MNETNTLFILPTSLSLSLIHPFNLSLSLLLGDKVLNIRITSLPDDSVCLFYSIELINNHLLILILLIILKEPPNLCQTVLWQVGNVGVITKLGIISVDGNDLIILLTLVEHAHASDGLGSEEGEGDYWLLHEDKDV